MKLGEALYREQQAQQAGDGDGQARDGSGGDGQSGEDVVDAEFEEVRDEDRKAPWR